MLGKLVFDTLPVFEMHLKAPACIGSSALYLRKPTNVVIANDLPDLNICLLIIIKAQRIYKMQTFYCLLQG